MARMIAEVTVSPEGVAAIAAERDELRTRLAKAEEKVEWLRGGLDIGERRPPVGEGREALLLEAFEALGEVGRHAVMALATALRDYRPAAAMCAPVRAALAAGGGQPWDLKTLHTNALAEEREEHIYWRNLAKSTRKVMLDEVARLGSKAATKRAKRLLKRAGE